MESIKDLIQKAADEFDVRVSQIEECMEENLQRMAEDLVLPYDEISKMMDYNVFALDYAKDEFRNGRDY